MLAKPNVNSERTDMKTTKILLLAALFAVLLFLLTLALHLFAGLPNDFHFTKYKESEGILYAAVGMFIGCVVLQPKKVVRALFSCSIAGLVAFVGCIGAFKILGGHSLNFTQYVFAEDVALLGALGLIFGLLPEKQKKTESDPQQPGNEGPAAPNTGG